MRFEHAALNVPDARAHADWYVHHLGCRIARRVDAEPFTRFLADESGRVFLELYTHPKAPVPDYRSAPPLVLHVAFVAADARVAAARLRTAGAAAVAEDVLPDGSVLVMLRDPWGVALQLCQRASPLPAG